MAGTFSAGGRTGYFRPDRMAKAVKHRWGIRPTINAGIFDPYFDHISLTGNLYYQSKSVTDEVNFSKVDDPSLLIIPSQTLLDLTLSWDKINGGPVSAYLSVTNVTDKTYPLAITQLADSIGEALTIYSEPRMIFAGLRMEF